MLKRRIFLTAFIVFVLLLTISSPAVKAPTLVTIGAIASSTDRVQSKQVIAQIAIEDINNYMTANLIPYQFQYEVKDAESSAQTHLQKVQEFNEEDVPVKFINGAEWSSMAQASLLYCDANHILLLSSSSTSPLLKKSGDNLFRLCPADDAQAPAIANMIMSYGYTHTIIIWRGDSWGDGLVDYFKTAYSSLGGTIVGDSSTRYPGSETVFSSYLKSAEKQMVAARKQYRTDKICILLFAFNEAAQIITEAKNYPTIYGTRWFGSDGTAQSWYILGNAPEPASHLRLFSPLPRINPGPSWQSVNDRYYAQMNQYLTSYTAYDYDIYWVLALSIVEANYVPGGDPTEVDAVKNVLPGEAGNYNGASGYCTLNEYGDRVSQGFDIWGYGTYDWTTQIMHFGYTDAENNVYWDSTAFRLYGYAYGSVTTYKDAYSSKIVKGNWDLTIDNWVVKFSLTYSEKNLNSAIEESPIGSIDNFYVVSYWENIVSQTSSSTVIQCMLNFRKDWARLDGTRETTYWDYPATITVSKSSIYIDLPTPIRYQNFDILGKTTSFKFN